jgi:hypothetical protein
MVGRSLGLGKHSSAAQTEASHARPCAEPLDAVVTAAAVREAPLATDRAQAVGGPILHHGHPLATAEPAPRRRGPRVRLAAHRLGHADLALPGLPGRLQLSIS